MIYLYLFLEFFKIGLFTFGGGYAMIPLVEETVLKYGWATENEFYNLIGVCESTPGPIAVNMATYIGSTVGGFFGSLLATLGVILPAFIIMLIISALLKNFSSNKTPPLCTYYSFAQTKEDSKGGKPLVVLGVGVYRGRGIETPAPIRLLCNPFLAPRKDEKKILCQGLFYKTKGVLIYYRQLSFFSFSVGIRMAVLT